MKAKRKRLGELVLRSANPQALVEFYRNVIGLNIYARLGTATFLKVDDDFEGHPQLLAIFNQSHSFSGPRDMQPDIADSRTGTLQHFAFALEYKDFVTEKERLQKAGVPFQLAEHPPFGWCSLYLHDPDGNSVEFVCYDRAVLDEAANAKVRQNV